MESKTSWALLAALILATSQAKADFVSGAVVGAALTSVSSTSKGNVGSVHVSSPTYDVISCEKHAIEVNTCTSSTLVKTAKGTLRVQDKPAVYAIKAGYKNLHKASVVIQGSREFILMEVSN